MNKLGIIGLLILVFAGFGIYALTGKATSVDNLESVTLKVSIPCEGHVYYIKSELADIKGIEKTDYLGQYRFQIFYNPLKISEDQILNLEVFKEFSAKKL